MAEQETKNAAGQTENQSGSQHKTDNSQNAQSGGETNKSENNKSENNKSEGGKSESGQTGGQTVKQAGNEIIGQVKEKATGVLDEQKINLTHGLTSVADSLRQVGDNLRGGDEQNPIGNFTAQYGDEIAKGIGSVSKYLDNADLKVLARDLERLARRQPALFVGGAFALGLLAARFLKSSSPNQNSANRGRGNRSGNQTSGENSSNFKTNSGNA